MIHKSKQLIIILSLIAMSIIFIGIFISNPHGKKQSDQNNSLSPNQVHVKSSINQNEFTGIVPDKTTKQQIIQKLGEPESEIKNGQYDVLLYQANNTLRSNKLYLSANTVKYMTEEVTENNTLLRDFLTRTHEKPINILYDPYELDSGYSWYVFSEDGVAYLSNKTGYVLRIQRFPKMSYQQYLNTIAKDLSLSASPPPPQN